MDMNRRHLLGTALGIAATAFTGGAASNAAEGEALIARTPDGLNLSVRAYGDPKAPEILFVHGLGQCRLSWDRQIASSLSRQFRLVTYDLRGHGDSDKPAVAAAYADGERWADDVEAVIEAAGLSRPTLVGWSLGGLVVGHYLARRGDRGVAGVNLVGAVTKLSPDLLTPASLAFATKLASPNIAVRATAIEEFLAACFAERPADPDFRRMLVFNSIVPRAAQEGVVKISGEGLDAAFAKIPRMLVTHGARDALVRLDMSKRVSGLNPHARLSIYQDAGHAPFYERPERFNAELAAFAAR